MEFYLFTIGYEKKSIQEYVSLLKKFKIKTLIDVREVAWSYKQDFRKQTLSKYLSKSRIKYIHLPEAGNPKSIRQSSNDISECLFNYKEYLKETDAGMKILKFLILKSAVNGENVCITCYEKDFLCCHRSVIVDLLVEKINKLTVVNIG